MSTNARPSDGYVRISLLELARIQMTHLVSEKDLTIYVPGDDQGTAITGMTEWVGWHGDKALSLGWDWGILQQAIVLLNPYEIRTNIQLVSADGYPQLPAIAKARLMDWIESWDWRTPIKELLAAEGIPAPKE